MAKIYAPLTDEQREIIGNNAPRLLKYFVAARGYPFEDCEEIVARAYLYICRQINSFDSSRSRFSTWSQWAVKKAITDHFRDKARNLFSNIDDHPDQVIIRVESDRSPDWNTCHQILKWNRFSQRNCQIVYARIWEDRKLEDVGKEFGLTRERVRQITSKAVKLFRAHENRL